MPARRPADTRDAILAAARERFAADGYERATIRAIAKDAGIDPSMVMRYYGNKEGLFAAAVSIDLSMPDPGSLLRQDVGRALVAHFLGMWEENEVLTALLRVGVTNRAGAERMQGVFRDQLMPVAREVCPGSRAGPGAGRARCRAAAGAGAHALRAAVSADRGAEPRGDRGVAGADAAAVSHGAEPLRPGHAEGAGLARVRRGRRPRSERAGQAFGALAFLG